MFRNKHDPRSTDNNTNKEFNDYRDHKNINDEKFKDNSIKNNRDNKNTSKRDLSPNRLMQLQNRNPYKIEKEID